MEQTVDPISQAFAELNADPISMAASSLSAEKPAATSSEDPIDIAARSLAQASTTPTPPLANVAGSGPVANGAPWQLAPQEQAAANAHAGRTPGVDETAVTYGAPGGAMGLATSVTKKVLHGWNAVGAALSQDPLEGLSDTFRGLAGDPITPQELHDRQVREEKIKQEHLATAQGIDMQYPTNPTMANEVVGTAGKMLLQDLPMAGVTGGATLAPQMGAEGYGGSKISTQARREQGQVITPQQEERQAALAGAAGYAMGRFGPGLGSKTAGYVAGKTGSKVLGTIAGATAGGTEMAGLDMGSKAMETAAANREYGENKPLLGDKPGTETAQQFATGFLMSLFHTYQSAKPGSPQAVIAEKALKDGIAAAENKQAEPQPAPATDLQRAEIEQMVPGSAERQAAEAKLPPAPEKPAEPTTDPIAQAAKELAQPQSVFTAPGILPEPRQPARLYDPKDLRDALPKPKEPADVRPTVQAQKVEEVQPVANAAQEGNAAQGNANAQGENGRVGNVGADAGGRAGAEDVPALRDGAADGNVKQPRPVNDSPSKAKAADKIREMYQSGSVKEVNSALNEFVKQGVVTRSEASTVADAARMGHWINPFDHPAQTAQPSVQPAQPAEPAQPVPELNRQPGISATRKYSSDMYVESFLSDLHDRRAELTPLEKHAFSLLRRNFDETVGWRQKPVIEDLAAQGSRTAKKAISMMKDAGLYWEPLDPRIRLEDNLGLSGAVSNEQPVQPAPVAPPVPTSHAQQMEAASHAKSIPESKFVPEKDTRDPVRSTYLDKAEADFDATHAGKIQRRYIQFAGEIVPVHARSVTIKGFEDIDLFVHPSKSRPGVFNVSEGASGDYIGSGGTELKAINNAKSRMRKHTLAELKQALEAQAKKHRMPAGGTLENAEPPKPEETRSEDLPAIAEKTTPAKNVALIQRLRNSADSMQKAIDQKLNPAVVNQNLTARRDRMATHSRDEGHRMQQVHQAMRGLADAHEDGTIPDILRGISTRAQVADIVLSTEYSRPGIHGWALRDLLDATKFNVESKGARAGLHGLSHEDWNSLTDAQVKDVKTLLSIATKNGIKTTHLNVRIDTYERLAAAGLDSADKWALAKTAISKYVSGMSSEQKALEATRDMESKLIGVKIPGFFPTPKPLIDAMLDAADIQPGDSVLEPSAGKGDILDAIRSRYPEAKASGIEVSQTLADIVKGKGHDVQNRDFLEVPTGEGARPNKIVMNPPFEKGLDIEHVQHAFDVLAPGGRLVAIMSEGPFYRADKQSTYFRKWLEDLHGTSEKNSEGSFTGKDAFRQTGVATRLVVIDKAAPELKLEPPAPKTPLQLAHEKLVARLKGRLNANAPLDPGLWKDVYDVVKELVKAGTRKIGSVITHLRDTYGEDLAYKVEPRLREEWAKMYAAGEVDDSGAPPQPKPTVVPAERGPIARTNVDTVDAERAAANKPEMPTQGRGGVEFADAQAKARIAANPNEGYSTVKKFVDTPDAPIQPADIMVLANHKQQLNKDLSAQYRIAADAASTDAQRAEALGRIRLLDAAVDDFHAAAKATSRTWHELGMQKKAGIADDFSPVTQIARAEAMKGGKLTDAERQAVANDAAQFEALQNEQQAREQATIDAASAEHSKQAEAEYAKAHAQAVVDVKKQAAANKEASPLDYDINAGVEAAARLRKKYGKKLNEISGTPEDLPDLKIVVKGEMARTMKATGKTARQVRKTVEDRVAVMDFDLKDIKKAAGEAEGELGKPPKTPTEKRAAIVEKIKKKVADPGYDSASLTKLAKQLQKSFLEEDFAKYSKDRNALVDAVHAELKLADPKITREDARDAMSGYGKFTPASTDPVKMAIADINTQLQAEGKLGDMAAGEAPKRTGQQRQLLSDEARQLNQQVNEKKREGGFVVTDPESQLQTSLASRETRLKHQIADTQKEIDTRQRIVTADKARPADTARITELKARLKDLKGQHEAIFGKGGLTDEQRLDAAIASAEKSRDEALRKIREGDIQTKKGTPTADPKRLADAKRQRDEALKDLAKLRRGPAKTKEERAAQATKTRLENEMKDFQKQIDTGVRVVNGVPVKLSTPELEAVRLAHSATKAAYHAAFKGEITAENAAKKSATYSRVLKKRLEALQEQEAHASSKLPPPEKKLTPAQLSTLVKIEELKQRIWQRDENFRLANRNKYEMIRDGFFQVNNTVKAIKTAYDASAPFRQGEFFSLAHPIEGFAKPALEMLKSISEKKSREIDAQLRNRAKAEFGEASKLELTSADGKFSKQEEAIRSRWSDYIPGIKLSNRMFRTFLNAQRAAIFDHLTSLAHDGHPTVAEGRVLARFVNLASGRGDTTSVGMQTHIGALGKILWAPRLLLSRLQLLVPYTTFKEGTASTRKIIAGEYLRAAASLAAVYGIGKLFGAKEKIDPRSTDFGKMRFGKTRVDPLAGLAQVVTFLSREITGSTKSPDGIVTKIRGEDVPFGKPGAWEVAANFIRTKLNPSLGIPIDYISQKNTVGQPRTLSTLPEDLLVPLAARDAYESIQAQGVTRGSAAGLLAMLGMGVQNYGEGETPEWKKDVLEKKAAGAEYAQQIKHEHPGLKELLKERATLAEMPAKIRTPADTRRLSKLHQVEKAYQDLHKANEPARRTLEIKLRKAIDEASKR